MEIDVEDEREAESPEEIVRLADALLSTMEGLPEGKVLTATTAWATTIDGVSYIDENGVAQTANGVTVLEGGGATTLSAGWYVVNSKIDYTGTVTLSGNISSSDYKAKLDGKTLTPINDPSGAREFTMVFDDVAGISEELRVKSEE